MKSTHFISVENYCGITLVPVVSEVFEGLLALYVKTIFILISASLNLDTVKGYNNAIYIFTSTVYHFVKRGSTVYVAVLEISKAFDKVDRAKLFVSFSDAGIPSCVINRKLFCIRLTFTGSNTNNTMGDESAISNQAT
jgi:hypothetical protein